MPDITNRAIVCTVKVIHHTDALPKPGPIRSLWAAYQAMCPATQHPLGKWGAFF